MRNITERLKIAHQKNLDTLVNELFAIYFVTQYKDLALNQAVMYLGNEMPAENKEPIGTKIFLDIANKRRDESDGQIREFAKRLEVAGNSDLSKWVIAYWSSMSPKPIPIETRD
jgi:hypothetical protein